MAADLHIHVFSEGELTEEDFRAFFSNTLGSRWFNPVSCGDTNKEQESRRHKIGETENIWVGEVSWLKAALFEDSDQFIPAPVMAVHETIGEALPIIDDQLIAAIMIDMGRDNSTGYSTGRADEVLAFLEKHRGKRAFTISW